MDDEYETPLHELCALAKSLGLHVDFAIYSDGCKYEGGARITGGPDPMGSIAAGVCALRERVAEQRREQASP